MSQIATTCDCRNIQEGWCLLKKCEARCRDTCDAHGVQKALFGPVVAVATRRAGVGPSKESANSLSYSSGLRSAVKHISSHLTPQWQDRSQSQRCKTKYIETSTTGRFAKTASLNSIQFECALWANSDREDEKGGMQLLGNLQTNVRFERKHGPPLIRASGGRSTCGARRGLDPSIMCLLFPGAGS